MTQLSQAGTTTSTTTTVAGRSPAASYDALLRWIVQLSLPATRIALGAVYLWYGALKIAGVSPAASLVRDMVSVIGSPSWIVPVFGVLEVIIGVWLLTGSRMRYLLPLFVAHMLGTLGVLVLLPGTSFQHHNPLELTFTGEFVTKNFVLLAAGITVIAATAVRQRATRLPALRCQGGKAITPDHRAGQPEHGHLGERVTAARARRYRPRRRRQVHPRR